jgi:integrase
VRKPRKKYRSTPTGSFMFDREFHGIGHLHRASRITNEAQFNLVNDALPDLAKTPEGRKVIAAMIDGTVTGLQVLVAIKNGGDFSALTGEGGTPLLTALEQWRAATERTVAKDTHRVRGELIAHLRTVAKPSTPVTDLPKLLRKLKLKMPSARSFNLDLQYASAFLRDTVGRRNELYLDVRDIDPRTDTPRAYGNPLTPVQVLQLAQAFDRVWQAKQGSRGAEVIAMALTGMGPAEYWGDWRVHANHVHIDGTKRDPRVRDVPRLFPCTLWPHETIERPAITRHSFERALAIVRVATGIPCAPYDFRRTFANWLEQADVLRSRRRQYMGHAVKDDTERYERHAVRDYLVSDGAEVRAWIDAELANANERQQATTEN